jgi:hypothetical protein
LGNQYGYNLIKEKTENIGNFLGGFEGGAPEVGAIISPGGYSVNETAIQAAAEILMARILQTMQYHFRDDTYSYYDYPENIRNKIIARVGEYNNVLISLYTKEVISDKYPVADDGFTFEIASDHNDAIRWLAVNKGIIIGTETSEWIIPPGVTAVNIYASLNSGYGSDTIQGVVINDATCFFQAGKKGLVEYYIPQQDNNFRANNMALLSRNMLAESPAVDFDFVRSPYTKLFITREDGTVVTLLYERSTGTFAWARFTTGGEVKSVAVLPGTDGNDDVYMIVKRGAQFFLEVLQEAGTVYLDSYKPTTAGSWAGDKAGYDAGTAAAVRMGADAAGRQEIETWALTETPDWGKGGSFYIGYPYTAVFRSMPVLANNEMKKQRITGLIFRFLKSFLPKVTSIAGGRAIKTDVITNLAAPYSGVHKITFPGTWDEDVQVELTHDRPEPVKILALNAEVQ